MKNTKITKPNMIITESKSRNSLSKAKTTKKDKNNSKWHEIEWNKINKKVNDMQEALVQAEK